MAARRPKAGMTPADRALADRISRARTATPPRGAEWYTRSAELAELVGADVNAVIDEFDERASVREYLGGVTRADAERLAFEDVRERFVRQGEMLGATTAATGR